MRPEGGSQIINLTEISTMTDDERREEESLVNVKSLLEDPKTLKIVKGVADLVRLGERIHHRLEPEDFVALNSWHPKLRNVFLSTVRYAYRGKYDALTLAFRGERHPGWRWQFNQDPETLSGEQIRLGYALTSSLISLALDGIVLRMFGHEFETRAIHRLGESLTEVLQEEVLLYLEPRQLEAVKLSDKGADKEPAEEVVKKKLRFMLNEGVTIAESLLMGYCRTVGVDHLHERSGRILTPQRKHIQDILEWEKTLEFIQIVPAMPIVIDNAWVFKSSERSILKKFDSQEIQIRKYSSLQDADAEELLNMYL